MSKNKKHFSVSQLNMGIRCLEQHRRRYDCGDIIPPSIALHRGTGFHKGSEFNFRQKMETDIDLPYSQIEEVAVGTLETAVKNEGIYLSPDEKTVGKVKVVEQGILELRTGTKLYSESIAPIISPLYVEETVRADLDDNTELVGRIDLIDRSQSILDLKLSSKSMAQDAVDSMPQLTMYSMLYESKWGKKPPGLSIYNTVLKKSPEVQVLNTTRQCDDYEALMRNIQAMIKQIANGAYTFAYGQASAWWCSPRFCGYWSTCPGVPKYKR